MAGVNSSSGPWVGYQAEPLYSRGSQERVCLDEFWAPRPASRRGRVERARKLSEQRVSSELDCRLTELALVAPCERGGSSCAVRHAARSHAGPAVPASRGRPRRAAQRRGDGEPVAPSRPVARPPRIPKCKR